MEDVLDVYTGPYDRARPLVCLDETSRQLLGEVRAAAAAGPGAAGALRSEYERAGRGQPVPGLRAAARLARRSGSASGGPGSTGPHCIKDLVDVHYPDAERIVLVHGQPEHPHAGLAVRGVPARRGQAAGRQAGDPLHAQARQLAEHGRDRAERPGAPMPGPPPARPRDARAGGRGLGQRRATPPRDHQYRWPRRLCRMASETRAGDGGVLYAERARVGGAWAPVGGVCQPGGDLRQAGPAVARRHGGHRRALGGDDGRRWWGRRWSAAG